MNEVEHEDAIARLSALSESLNQPAIDLYSVQQALKLLVAEALAQRTKTKTVDGGNF